MRYAPLCVLVVAIGVAAPRAATAQVVTAPAVVKSSSPPRRTIYLELFGKGGLWGLGYSHQLSPRFGVGVVGSFTTLDGQRIYSLSPFATAYLVGRHRHRWFVDLGAQVLRVSTPSPVPEWRGTSETGVGAQLATGYEYRGPVVVRGFAMTVAGKGGLAPWIGVDVGWAF